jgi:tRNA threonylcarbamoyladenosine biosynthesis protein TsaE
MQKYVSNSLEETQKLAAEWLQKMTEKNSALDEALVVGLSGHLGAGKTAFTKAVSKEMGIQEEITSPTFVIMKLYETKHPNWKRLVHIDAYRLERVEELEALGWENLVQDKNNLILMEWPENVGLKAAENIKFENLGDRVSIQY